MAHLTQHALQNPVFRQIVQTAHYEKPASNKQLKAYYDTTNKLLRKGPYYYKYAIGVKTGHTMRAGNTFVAAAEKDDRLLIAVVLRCNNRPGVFKDAKKLFEKAFSEKRVERVLLPEGSQSFSCTPSGAKNVLYTLTQEPLRIVYYPSEEPTLRCQLFWDDVALPIKAGQKVGEIRLITDGGVTSVALLAKNNVEEAFLSMIKRYFCQVFNSLVDHWILAIILLCIVFAAFYYCCKK